MKFMFTIYHDEDELEALPEKEMQALVDSALDYDDEIRRSGHYIVSDALQPARTARTDPRPRRQGFHDRRAVRRDEGAARRLFPHRGQEHGRGVRGGLAVSAGAHRHHRSPPGPGAEALLIGTRSHERTHGRPRPRGGGRGLPVRVAPRPRHPHPPARRLRPRRGGAARGLRRRGRAVAARRARRPIRGPGSSPPAASRPSTPCAGAPASTPRSWRSPSASRRKPCRTTPGQAEDIEDDRLRLIFTCCHPGPVAGRPGGADPPRGLRPDDRGDRPRLSHRRRPRSPSASSAPRRRSATRAFPTRCRRCPSCRIGWTRSCT